MRKKSKSSAQRQSKRSTINRHIKSAVADSVKRELNTRVEVKTMAPSIFPGNRVTNYLFDPSTQSIPLVPTIAQGAGQGERIGNKVRVKKATLNINVECDPFSSSNSYVPPMYFDIYIYKYRRSNNQGAVELGKFLQYGNTSTSYDSNSLFHSGNLSVNKDSFVLKKKKRCMLWHQNTTNTTGATSAITNMRNLLICKNFNFDITKYLKKTQDFQDATTNTPEDNLYVSVVFTPADYTTSYVQNQIMGSFTSMMQFSYEDM